MNIQRNQPIESGKLLDAIKSIFKSLDNLFKKWGDEIVLEQKNVKTPEGDPAKILKLQTADEEHTFYVEFIARDPYSLYVDLRFKDDKGDNLYELKRVDNKDSAIEEAINEYVKKCWGEDAVVLFEDNKPTKKPESEPTKSCVKITLSKITSATGVSVNMVNVMSDWSPSDTLSAVSDIISDDSFIAEIPESQDTSFEITLDADDNYCVTQCDDVMTDCCKALDEILYTLYNLSLNSRWIAINTTGSGADNVACKCEQVRWIAEGQIDQLSKLSVSLCGASTHPRELLKDFCGAVSQRFTAEEALTMLASYLQNVIDALELYWCMFTHDVQTLLDTYLTEWKQSKDYNLLKW